MWALSTSDGASTSALNCHLVRVRVKERIGGNYYWTGYVYDDDGDVELRNAYTTVGGGHGARPNSSASWTTLTT